MKRLAYWFRYRQLLWRIENVKIYDGRNKGIDVYECSKCGHKLYTYYKDKGVTPFTISCPKCSGIMIHAKTVGTTPGVIPIPWFRPTFKQMLKLSPRMIEHVLQGGLILKTHLK
jgi:hypothetical protein